MEKRDLRDSKGSPCQPRNLRPIFDRQGTLLSDPKFRSCGETRSLRSWSSAETSLRQYEFLLVRLDVTPENVVSMAKKNPDVPCDVSTRDEPSSLSRSSSLQRDRCENRTDPPRAIVPFVDLS